MITLRELVEEVTNEDKIFKANSLDFKLLIKIDDRIMSLNESKISIDDDKEEIIVEAL